MDKLKKKFRDLTESPHPGETVSTSSQPGGSRSPSPSRTFGKQTTQLVRSIFHRSSSSNDLAQSSRSEGSHAVPDISSPLGTHTTLAVTTLLPTTVPAPELHLTPSHETPPAVSPVTSHPIEAEPSPSAEKPALVAPERPPTNPTIQPVVDEPSSEKAAEGSRLKDGLWTVARAGGLILDIATESSDAFPPLKSVLGGIRALVNTYEKHSDNKTRKSALQSRLETLEQTQLADSNNPSEKRRRNTLQRQLNIISQGLDRISHQSTIGSISNIKHDEGTISGFLDDLSDALTDYQLSLQQHILETGLETIAKVDLLLLDKLPHAKGAGFRGGNCQRCLKGTRREIMDLIYAWAHDFETLRVYWLNGKAGTGKSTICQSFTEYCFAQGILGASFFCSRDFSDRNTLDLIFTTLALDLAYKYPAFRTALLKIIETTPDAGSQSLSLQLETLLIRPLESSGISTIIVIDALDECKDDKPASALLSMLGQHIDDLPLVKFFITGRPEPPITLGFRLPVLRPHTEVFQLHNVEPVSVDHDIRLYFETQLADLVTIRSNVKFPVPWPDGNTIEALVRKAGGLFIFASTTYKFVAYRVGNPPDLLKQVLTVADDSSYEGRLGLDSLYTRILSDNYSEADAMLNVFQSFRPILGAVVVVSSPLRITALAKLLGLETITIETLLDSLHSVLHVPESELEPVRFLHKSFPDFLTDKQRCSEPQLHIDPAENHAHLASRCLELMNTSLKRNICEAPPYIMNKKIKDLHERREKYIGEALEYACTSWAQHLAQASRSDENVANILKKLDHFLRHYFLMWLEVLSLCDTLQTAVHSLRAASSWLTKDGERFILHFYDNLLNVSASQIYVSAISLAPKNSIIRQFYQPRAWNVSDESWDACIRKINLSDGRCIVFSHQGDRVAACEGKSHGSFLVIIEAATGIVLSTFKGHDRRVYSVAFSPDDLLLISGSDDRTVRLWDIQTGGLIKTLPLEDEVACVGFSHDGSMVACTFGIWDQYLEGVVHRFVGKVTCTAWSQSKAEIVLGYDSGNIQVLDVMNGTYRDLGHPHKKSISSLAYSRDGGRVVSGSDGEVKIHDAVTGDILQTFDIENVRSVCFSREGEKLVIAHRRSMVSRDLANSLNVAEFEQPYDTRSVSVSPDGMSIVLADKGKLSIWQTNGPIRSSEATTHHSEWVKSVAISPDLTFIVSGSNDRTVKLWDFATGACLHTFEGHSGVCCVAISPTSLLVASGSYDKLIRIWNVTDHTLVCILQGHSTYVSGLDFSPDGQMIASVSSDGVVRLWEIKGEKVVGILEETGFANTLSSELKVRFSEDGAGITVYQGKESRSWKIVPCEVPSSADPTHSYITFVPHEKGFDNPFLPLYDHKEKSEWITDRDGRRIFWLPEGFRLPCIFHCQGSKVVMGFRSGRVCWFDFGSLAPSN